MRNMKLQGAIALVLTIAMLFAAIFGSALVPEKEVPGNNSTVSKSSDYKATAKGFGGDVTATVTVKDGVITAIKVVGDKETPALGGVAIDTLPALIVSAGSLEVDGVSGATVTSNAIKTAVAEAALKAGIVLKNTVDASSSATTDADSSATTDADSSATTDASTGATEEDNGNTTVVIPNAEGTFEATATGFGGKVTVTVEIANGKIVSCKAEGPDETKGIGSKAIEILPGQVVSKQTLDVDAVSGATVTSNAFKKALKEAVAKAGLSAEDFAQNTTETTEKKTIVKTADVVIVGAGGAGMTAAITAAKEGKTVILIESQAMVGGNSVRATGGMNAAKTEYQDLNVFAQGAGIEKTLKSAEDYKDNAAIQTLAAKVKEQWEAYQKNPTGYFDSIELFELDTMIGGKGLNNPSLVHTLAEKSAEGIAWLETIKAKLNNVGSFGGASVMRIHRPVNEQGKTVSVGAYIVPVLEEAVNESGVELLLTTTAKSIIMNNGNAAGIIAEDAEGNTIEVNAQAVVLATGGFGANLEMVASYNPELKGFVTTNAAGIQGTGIKMAEAVGAALVDIEQIQIHPTVEQNTSALITEGLRGDGAILVNAEGLRFCDEVGTRDVVSAAIIAQTNSNAWLIVDQKMVDASAVIAGYITKGFTVEGKTYAELAKAMGVDAANLEATMNKWNECVANGKDEEFGRTSFAKALDQGSFYAIQIAPGIHHTMGGVKINTNAEVLDKNDNVIPGLFAAGEITGGVHGANRLGGNAVADFVVFGRIAGASACKFVDGIETETFEATATGFGGKVTVTVEIANGKIVSCKAEGPDETKGIGSKAIEILPGQVVSKQTLDVDAVSGATVTSNAFKKALKEAVAKAGLSAEDFAQNTTETTEKKTIVKTADVVIVGAGGAGMTAAITAAKEGKTVILIESQAMVGGNSVRATGGMNAAKTEYQDLNVFAQGAGIEKTLKSAEDYKDNAAIQTLAAKVKEQWEAYQKNPTGYFDSIELFELDTMIGGKGLNNPSLVHTLAEKSAEGIAWLETIKAKLNNVGSFGGASVMRIHRPVNEQGKTVSVGAYIVPVLEEAVNESGVELLLTTTAKSIIMNNGNAAGIIAEDAEGNTIEVNAQAVVLATGGFGANLEMVASYNPELKGFVTTNAAGIQGTGIKMAEAVGAALVDIEQIQIHPTVEQNTSALITEGLRGDGAILVNAEGLRFCDEVGTRDVVSAAIIAQTNSNAWLIVDQKMVDASAVIAGYITKGFTVEGKTYAELAKAMGVDAANLEATMNKWNECVANGKDEEFGRTSFAKALDQGSFYAIQIAPGIHHTMGGVKINTNAEVLDKNDNVIPGLFAAGEITGGVHGANRLGGNAVADFVVFGRIAGESACKYVGR
ncbi:MAG: flavocytochrome c [Lachnospiraceae bacterium]|nr:flavocytochrome c [Lachnospiraceae bacterium]